MGTKHSERQTIPSSKWNEKAGFVAEPPCSAKKKLAREGFEEGMPSNPLLISDWSNGKITSCCKACGIFFLDSASHLIDCISHICSLENLNTTPSRGTAMTSSQGHLAEASLEVRKS